MMPFSSVFERRPIRYLDHPCSPAACDNIIITYSAYDNMYLYGVKR